MDPVLALGAIAFMALCFWTVWGIVALGKLVFRFWNWVDNELQQRQR